MLKECISKAALVITQAGFCVLYVIFVSQTMEDIRIPLTLNKTTWALALAPVFFILTLYRNVKVLAPASAVANVFILLGFFVVLEEEVRHVREQGFSQEIEANRYFPYTVYCNKLTRNQTGHKD